MELIQCKQCKVINTIDKYFKHCGVCKICIEKNSAYDKLNPPKILEDVTSYKECIINTIICPCCNNEYKKSKRHPYLDWSLCTPCRKKRLRAQTETIKCTTCKIIKTIDNFHKGVSYTNGYRTQCKECLNIKRNNRLKNSVNKQIAQNLRTRLYMVLKKYIKKKVGSHIKYLGCSIQELGTHLEAQFKDNMSWENYGKWHIDHIKPLSKFDLENIEEFKVAVHYTNLQPLWAKDNISKGNR